MNSSASSSHPAAVTGTACSLGPLSGSEWGAVRRPGLSAGSPKEAFLHQAVS